MGDPCDNGGTCLTPEAAEYVCMCPEGYDGDNCENDFDVCGHINPCKNNATCLNTGPSTYGCFCQEGFSGRDCELRIATKEGSGEFIFPWPNECSSTNSILGIHKVILHGSNASLTAKYAGVSWACPEAEFFHTLLFTYNRFQGMNHTPHGYKLLYFSWCRLR